MNISLNTSPLALPDLTDPCIRGHPRHLHDENEGTQCNGLPPCNIKGLRVPGTCATTHYVPLDRSRHPDVYSNPNAIQKYDPLNLPLRTHAEIIHLSSLKFPTSFPYDFIHLIYESLLKNLILLWTGEYKGLDEGQGSYKFNLKVWEAIGSATTASGSTISGAFGPRPHNVSRPHARPTCCRFGCFILTLSYSRKFRRRV